MVQKKTSDSHMSSEWLQQDIHKVKPFKSSPKDSYRWKAVHVQFQGLRLEVCSFWWTDKTYKKTHWGPTFSMSTLWEGLFQIWPFVTAHEAPSGHVNVIFSVLSIKILKTQNTLLTNFLNILLKTELSIIFYWNMMM